MRVGTFAYAHPRGLGHLARDFHRHGLITDVLVVRHPSIPSRGDEWYPGSPQTDMRSPDVGLMRDFCCGKDAMLFFESPHQWGVFPYCREIGVRSYLCVMHECSPAWVTDPARRPHKFLCPSLLDMHYFPDGTFLPLPVEYPWRLRTCARHYVHNGGYLGIRGREGTTLVIEAMRHVKSPLRLTIRVQENVGAGHQRMAAADPRVEYIAETVPYESLYAEGEVCVGAQKWNGCSLPLQEARASGMLVMNTDRYPANTWLPREPLIPVSRVIPNSSIGGPYLRFEESVVEPEAIAAKMDEYFEKDISGYSLSAKDWAASMSWEVLGPKWKEALES